MGSLPPSHLESRTSVSIYRGGELRKGSSKLSVHIDSNYGKKKFCLWLVVKGRTKMISFIGKGRFLICLICFKK